MIDYHVIELINKEVDGVASAEETAHLKLALKENPEAREFFEELHSLSKAMSSMVRPDPPPALKPSILRALDSQRISRKPLSRLSTLFRALRGPVLIKSTFIFAGGLAAGLLVFTLISDHFLLRSVDDSELTGTLVLDGRAPGFLPGDHIDINQNGMIGSIETQFSPGLCLLRLRLDAQEMIHVSLLTDSGSVQVAAVRPVGDLGGQMALRNGELTLEGAKAGGVVVLFSSKASAVPPARVRFSSPGHPGFETIIALEKSK